MHHLRPRARGGLTRLDNCVLLCSFHHLIAVHRWGWTLTLHAAGPISATDPGGTRTLRSHGPPRAAAGPSTATEPGGTRTLRSHDPPRAAA